MFFLNLIKKLFESTVSPIKKLSPFQERIIRSRQAVQSLKARAEAQRTPIEKLADAMTASFGNIWFLIINVIWFTIWIAINLGGIKEIAPFDPFPFGLLTMIVSLEAIILAIFVLISQNREQKVNSLRDEFDVQIDLITENEVTKVMELVVLIAKKQGINVSDDEVLQEMLKPLNKEKIEKTLEKEIQ